MVDDAHGRFSWRLSKMSWQRRLGPLVAVVAMASACGGGGDTPAPEQAVSETTTTIEAPTTSAADVQASPTIAPTTTADIADEAPETLAFSSSSDLGRLFEIEGLVAPATSAGSETLGDALSDGTLVQATSLRSSDGRVWVRINTTDETGSVLGWVPADDLRPTSQSIERFDADAVTEFRKVSSVVIDDELPIFAAAGGGSAVGFLAETEVAMHGGSSVLTADGVLWLDVIDSTTLQRRGYVEGASFGVLGSIEAKAPDGTDVDRRADSTITYGASLSAGAVSAVGCNAEQITFEATSSTMGAAVLFGNVPPVGAPLDSSNTRFRWSSSGGSTVYLAPGQTVTFSFPSASTKTWYFTTLDDEAQANYVTSGGSARLDASGRATATDVQSFQVDAGACGQPDPVEPVIDPYVYDLPPGERDAEIAKFEQELAEFRAANGIAPPPESEVEGSVEEDATSDEDAATSDEDATTATEENTTPVPDGAGENSDPDAFTTTGT